MSRAYPVRFQFFKLWIFYQMNHHESTVDTLEVDKFGVYEEDWWDKEGEKEMTRKLLELCMPVHNINTKLIWDPKK